MTVAKIRNTSASSRLVGVLCCVVLLASACGSSSDPGETGASTASDTTAASSDATTEAVAETTAETSGLPDATTAAASETSSSESPAAPDSGTAAANARCAEIATKFVTRGSANADLDDPKVTATCEGDTLKVASNGIPDYTYIETSPGQPRDRGYTFTFPATPTVADNVTAVPRIGTAAVTLGGIPIFGPTEGTGGDVGSLPGILSECGSHNGPSGFHIHLILTSGNTDCLFTAEEVAAKPQLVGFAFDGYPIYTGVGQYKSSWKLTDETLFATDTWSAHTYVAGSGDLDKCNGLTDGDGNYAYYTTATFPYILGCYTGVVDVKAAGGGGGPETGGTEESRPARPETGGAGGSRPARPEPAAENEAE